jgi:hypothetical protein
MNEYKELWEISDELLEAMDALDIDPETGEISQESFEQMDVLSGDFNEKLQDSINYLRRKTAEANIAKEESEKIKKYGKVLEKKVENFSEYVKNQMQKIGVKKIVISGRPASVVKNPDSVEVDKSILPKEWFRITTKEDPDKIAIMKHIKSGETAPKGVTLISEKKRLQY